ncbi:TetR/AcrR family transcriptional regulator [Mycobacterium sp. M26]|uniref:TetR/AcrR family transcriptional regulator n=1 Tax=Mycobacterium sp. M26 TaxID=1762962 RepID=UPI00073E7076|nr:TetR/AcrR family transcriptional regulator [Mycobacterium sp. M26]
MVKSTGGASASSSLLGRPVGANSEETRKRILEATMRCIAQVGYSRATIREIAREAQMTSGSLYHYFPNKAELVKATFDEVATIAVPRLAQAADRNASTLDKLMAVLDESVRVMRDYPLAVAFDRAIRAESPAELHLAENSDTRFVALRGLIRDILEQGANDKVLGAGVDIDSAANAVYMIFRGLNEYAASTPPADEYHATVAGLKKLLRGQLFDYDRLSR